MLAGALGENKLGHLHESCSSEMQQGAVAAWHGIHPAKASQAPAATCLKHYVTQIVHKAWDVSLLHDMYLREVVGF